MSDLLTRLRDALAEVESCAGDIESDIDGLDAMAGDIKCRPAVAIVNDLATLCAELRDALTLDGKALSYKQYVYYMMNKPQGVVSATEDKLERTVLDILPAEYRRDGLFPAGRLDKDTTGLLILTDDGDYAHRMLSPKKHVTKRYIATLDKTPGEEISARFEEGIVLGDGTVCKSGQARILDHNRVEVAISEGKYHQVKRMFAALGYRVTALERIQIGALALDRSLTAGHTREMTENEAQAVFLTPENKP